MWFRYIVATSVMHDLDLLNTKMKLRAFTIKVRVSYIVIPIALLIFTNEVDSSETSKDAHHNFTLLANENGHACYQYSITTEDKYILNIFNIPGNTNRTVFLMHGLIDSADTFIIRGNGSMALALAAAGYDVWLGNMRGNKYSRSHLSLDPDTDKEYWNFSFHEIGYYDLPASIDFILNRTRNDKLQAIGHSEGTTVFYVLGATRPEYNDKISVFISLAPIAYVQNTRFPLSALIEVWPVIDDVLILLGVEELVGNYSLAHSLMEVLCAEDQLAGYIICADGIFFEIAGCDPEELEPEFYPTVIWHFPAGTSRKNVMHLDQVGLREQFAQYDYGCLGNLMRYGTIQPPEYDLSKVTMPISLFVGKNDKMSTIADVTILRRQLPNVVDYREMKHEEFNHIDFVWGKHMYLYLFPSVFEVLENH